MTISLNAFDELCTRVSSAIDNRNLRTRSRTESEQTRFEYAVKYLLTVDEETDLFIKNKDGWL